MDLDESFYNSVHFVTLYLVFSFQGLAAELEHAFLHIMTPAAARKCSINKSVWSLYIWYLRPWICLFAHANLAKLIFMELLRQTVFILTNEHKWEKNLWYFDVNHLHHSPRAEKDPRCTWFYRISHVIFEMMPAKSGALFRHENPNLIYWHFLQKWDFAQYAKN